MTFKPILWTYNPKKNGECPIKIYCHVNGAKRYIPTGLFVELEHWDEDKGLVLRSRPNYQQMNSVIRSKTIELEQKALKGEPIVTVREKKKSRDRPNICEFITIYVEEIAKGKHDLAQGTVSSYLSLKLRLDQFGAAQGKAVQWEDVDLDWYNDFWVFLHHSFKMAKVGGFSKHIKNLKKFMREAHQRGIHTNSVFENKGFKVHKSTDQKIYLSSKEVEQIENLALADTPWLEAERDRWLLCYYFLMRYGDGQDHISKGHFFETDGQTYFRYSAQKTGTPAILPVKPKALELLKKYNYQLPKTTNVEANRKIKLIASMAGINAPATENGMTAPKCNFVRTHTARRSAATNLAIEGVPLDFIAKLGGWKNLDILQRYLLATGLDVARISRGYRFFE